MFALRGAISVERNEAPLIHAAAARVVRALLDRNGLAPADLVSAFFTSTPDLDAAHPATGARLGAGLGEVPLMGAVELAVPGSAERIIRVMLHVDGAPRRPVTHVFLEEAAKLRPDLAG